MIFERWFLNKPESLDAPPTADSSLVFYKKGQRINYNIFANMRHFALADPGGGAGPGPPLTPTFEGPKIEHFEAISNFSKLFCLTLLSIFFL